MILAGSLGLFVRVGRNLKETSGKDSPLAARVPAMPAPAGAAGGHLRALERKVSQRTPNTAFVRLEHPAKRLTIIHQRPLKSAA
jgi:hypothetical protein